MSIAFGQRLRKAREREGLTQLALADKVGVSQGAVTFWEQGREPSEENLKNLERVLGSLSGTKKIANHVSATSELSSFGYWLREQRVNAGLSVPELAKRAKVSIPAIYNIESGKIQNPQASTRDKLAGALKAEIPDQVVEETLSSQSVSGLGALTDFQPNEKKEWPICGGVYVLYDISQRPVYVGKAENIASRLASHFDKFWFKPPIVEYGSFIEVRDKQLRHQLEQALIRFLKSNAVINKQSTEQFEPSED